MKMKKMAGLRADPMPPMGSHKPPTTPVNAFRAGPVAPTSINRPSVPASKYKPGQGY